MRFQIMTTDPFEQPAECLVVFAKILKKGGFELLPHAHTLDAKYASLITTIAQKEDFDAKIGNVLSFHIGKERNMVEILLLGVGNPETMTMRDWLDSMAAVGKTAKKMHSATVGIVLEDALIKQLGDEKIAEGVSEGMILGTYEFSRYKEEQKKIHSIKEVAIIADGQTAELTEGLRKGELFAEATVLARDLVNEPSSVTTPTFLASFARSLADEKRGVTVEILEKKEMEKLGMGGILGIAKGSDEAPKLIVLRYVPAGRSSKTVALVGKGVTFDSGGLSLKSDKGMENMKIDMAGAAAILGIFSVVSRLDIPTSIVGVIPAVENMPSGRAIKPGDVVKTYNGKTIEIISTDAEGRVILADALAWTAQTVKPSVMVDLATLTGACMVALGEDIAGLFTPDEPLQARLREAAKQSGESLWPLPLFDGYKELLKSDIADIRNLGHGRYGGALTAGLFLQTFVPEDMSWAHLDIAGPAWAEKQTAFAPMGGTGYGVRLMLAYLTSKE